MLAVAGAISSVSLFAADIPGRSTPKVGTALSLSTVSHRPAASASLRWWRGAGNAPGTTLPAATDRFSILPFHNHGRGSAPGSQLAMNQPASGVYRTEPYSSIVIVPPAHPDDRCLVGRDVTQQRMPTANPELQLIPWKQK